MKNAALVLGLSLACTASATAFAAKTNEAGVFYYSLNDLFMSQVADAVNEAAAADGLSLTSYNADDDLVFQLEQLDIALTKGNSPLIVNIVDTMNGANVVEKAKAYDVPVIFFNRRPSDEVLNSYDKAWYIGSDGVETGAAQAEILLDYLKQHPEADKNGDGIINLVMLKGEANHQDTIGRTASFMHTIEASDYRFQPLYIGTANWKMLDAAQMMENVIGQYGLENIEAIVCNNDEMALGALTALNAAGYNRGGNDKYIPLLGIDGTPIAREAVDKGRMTGTVLNDARAIGRTVVSMAEAVKSGMGAADIDGLEPAVREIKVPTAKIVAMK